MLAVFSLAAVSCMSAEVTNIYLLVGQSNMAGRGRLFTTNRIDTARVVKWNVREMPKGTCRWVEAVEPIVRDRETAGAGPAASFGRRMADSAVGAVIGLVPAAEGASGINDWVPGGVLFRRAVDWAREALATGGVFRGILWHQGEADCNALNAPRYEDSLVKVVEGFRRELGDVPFVAGELGAFFTSEFAPCVNRATRRVMERMPNCAFVSSDGLVNNKGDFYHFDTASARTLGMRYAEAMLSLKGGRPLTRPVLLDKVGPLKVLMIGNSFSEPVEHEMPRVAAAMGLRLDIASAMIGGSELKRHWENYLCAQTNAEVRPYFYHRNICGVYQGDASIDRTGCRKANLLEAIRDESWDIITVHQASFRSMAPETYRPWGDELVAALRKLVPRAKIYVQETWYYLPYGAKTLEEGVADQQEKHRRIAAAYAEFAKRNRIDGVVPTGTAVQLYRERLPVVYEGKDKETCGDPVGKDGVHLGSAGEYLQSLVWTARLFGVDVTKCPYVSSAVADKRHADVMKACAMAAVRGEVPQCVKSASK